MRVWSCTADRLAWTSTEAARHAERLDNAVWTNQFDNTANRRAHLETTGPEILQQTEAIGGLDGFICATGTGGTLAGVTRYLKDATDGRVKCYLADPPGSVLYSYIKSGGKLADRQGSSITEGPSCVAPEAHANLTCASCQALARAESPRTSNQKSKPA